MAFGGAEGLNRAGEGGRSLDPPPVHQSSPGPGSHCAPASRSEPQGRQAEHRQRSPCWSRRPKRTAKASKSRTGAPDKMLIRLFVCLSHFPLWIKILEPSGKVTLALTAD